MSFRTLTYFLKKAERDAKREEEKRKKEEEKKEEKKNETDR